MALKLLLIFGLLSCSPNFSKGSNRESIGERIVKINEADGAPNCLEDGDILGDNCHGNAAKRNAVRDRRKLWHTRLVPYVLDPSLTPSGRRAIQDAIRDFHLYTCIRLVKVTPKSKRHYIKFFHGKGCYSMLGKKGGRKQVISIGHRCDIKGIAIHEIMHALGFYHEQSRYDRDSYIKINWSNIQRKRRKQFKKKQRKDLTTLGLSYDYDGIMHYGPYAFAIDKTKPTIVKKLSIGGNIGQRSDFSYTDLAQINTLYSCESRPGSTWSKWSSWSTCIRFGIRRREQRQRFCMAESLKDCHGAGRKRTQKQQRHCETGITGRRRTVVCEGQIGILICKVGYLLRIHSVNYGRTNRYVCNGPGRSNLKTNCYSTRRSLRVVKNDCEGKRYCVLLALNSFYGDPCRGTYKYLDVKYSCYRQF